MIDDARGRIDYDEQGHGPTMVLAPGSCSTGAAWRPLMAAWGERYRYVTTSLPGYGETDERRAGDNNAMSHIAESLEAVIRRAGDHVHLVGHSFGGAAALAVAMRKRVRLKSLTIIDAPIPEILTAHGEQERHDEFRAMTDAYFADYAAGNAEAIGAMIDWYGGPGTWASWPEKVRAYAIATTPVNHRDWATCYSFALQAAALAKVKTPTLVLRGSQSAPSVSRANELLSWDLPEARLATIDGAAHFMIATHAGVVAPLIAQHVARAEAQFCAAA